MSLTYFFFFFFFSFLGGDLYSELIDCLGFKKQVATFLTTFDQKGLYFLQ